MYSILLSLVAILYDGVSRCEILSPTCVSQQRCRGKEELSILFICSTVREVECEMVQPSNSAHPRRTPGQLSVGRNTTFRNIQRPKDVDVTNPSTSKQGHV